MTNWFEHSKGAIVVTLWQFRLLKIFAFVISLFIAASMSACGPNSPLVFILGKDMPNFVDKTTDQKEPAKLTGEYLFLYLDQPKGYVERKGPKDKIYLRLKNSKTGEVKTIFEGHSSYRIEHAFILPETRTIVFTWQDRRFYDDKVYVTAYNYEKNETLGETLIWEHGKYWKPPHYLSAFLDGVDLCQNNTSLCIRTEYKRNPGDAKYSWDFYTVNIKTGVRQSIDEETYRKLLLESHMNSAARYESWKHGKRVELFYVFQYHDRIRENPKPKYNGIYIKDGKYNIRISRLEPDPEILTSTPVWVDDDRKVIIGRYLVDIEGKQRATSITDGRMLNAAPVKQER